VRQGKRSIPVRPRSIRPTHGDESPTIKSIRVYGYKSIARSSAIQLAPLTLLAGANSSGKSSFFQPILLVKQTLETSTDPGPLLLDGPNVKFASADEMYARRPGAPTPARSFGIGFDLSDGRMLELKFARPLKPRGLVVASTIVTDPGLGIENLTISEKLSDRARSVLETLPKPFGESPGRRIGSNWDVTRRRCFLEVTEVFDEDNFRYEVHTPLDELVRVVEERIGGVIHLPGLRGNPARAYPRTPVGSTYTGQFQDYVASIVHSWQTVPKDLPKLRDVVHDLLNLRLTSEIQAVEVGDTSVGLRVGRLLNPKRRDREDVVSIADVGLGMSQVLPVVVALRVAEPGQVVILEQPELHLHPIAQRELAGVLVRAAKRGVYVIVETHSSLLLRGIQTLVALDEISPDLVSLNWFTRDPATGISMITSGRVDGSGRFGSWPEDFDDVALQAETDYLNAVQSGQPW
jgi:hypothetical protein